MSGYVIDSSGWLEYFIGGKLCKNYFKYINSTESIWTPSLVVYEVYKKIAREKSEAEGILVITHIETQSKEIIPLDDHLALFAADVSIKHKLAMADAIIYATTLQQEATLVTSDKHFRELENVILI